MVEAGVTSAGSLRRIGIDALEILDDRFHRGMQAVEIESVKAGLSETGRKGVIVRSQPLDKLDHIGVASHPSWEAPKVAERFLSIHIIARIAHIAVDAVGVWPVPLDRDGCKALLLDQPFRDLGALAVELVRAVGRLAKEHKACVADQVHQWIVVRAGTRQRVGRLTHRLEKRGVGRF